MKEIIIIGYGGHSYVCIDIIHAMGMTVSYPGLVNHPDHALMSQLHCPDYGYGGILTLDMGSEANANELLDLLQNEYRFGYVAVSLG